MKRYQIWIEDSAKAEIRTLPGHVRQRVRQAITALADDPRPSTSRMMTPPEGIALELRRIRLDKWRIVYAIDEADSSIGVFAVRRRPPYNYEDLADLLAE